MRIGILIPLHAKPHARGLRNTMESPSSTPLPRKRGRDLSFGRRYATVVESALAIPPGSLRIPRGSLAPPPQIATVLAPSNQPNLHAVRRVRR